MPLTYFFEDIGVNEKNNAAQLQEIIKFLNKQNILFEKQNDLHAKLLKYLYNKKQ